MAELFGRSWSLVFGDERWTDLRVVFEISRSLTKHPDPAQITIYNLATKTRSGFYQGAPVRLTAGYRDAAGLIYAGTLTGITPNRDGPDYAVALTCRDGDAAYQASVRRSYASAAPLDLVIKDLAASMGLTVGDLSAVAGLRTRGPLAHVGYGQEKLSQLLAPYGLVWCMIDGAIQIVTSDGATTEDAVLLTPDTGLVGAPEPITDKVPPIGAAVRRLRVTSLLQPGLLPGRKVKLESVEYSGVYRVDRLVHKGDTHGQDWYSVAEVSRVQGAA